MVVDAVSSKPLSAPHFPANREINREILRFLVLRTRGAAGHTARFTVLNLFWGSKGTGIFLRHQGINIPYYEFGQRKFVDFCVPLSRKTPQNPTT
jgi:hypothetical protein